jgi:hypothetical protein
MAKILKNTTISDIVLKQLGREIPASSSLTLNVDEYLLLGTDDSVTELTTYINSGDIVINNGSDDLSVVDGLAFIQYPDHAKNSTFDNSTNGFTAMNTQAAIEESRNNEGNNSGRTFTQIFFNNGNTANKWLFHIPTNEATDTLPFHTPFDIDIYGIGFSNKTTNISCDIEIYLNGTTNPDKIYTVNVINSKFYHDTSLNALFTMSIGDNLSIFIKKVGGSTPASVEVDLYCRINSNTVGEQGSN